VGHPRGNDRVGCPKLRQGSYFPERLLTRRRHAEQALISVAFFRGLAARGLAGVRLVTSDAHRGLVAAIGAILPGASWQRRRTHYLLALTPKSSQPWVATLVRTIFDQAGANEVTTQFDRVVEALAEKLPRAAEHVEEAKPTCSPSPPTRARAGSRSGRRTPRNG
jgi:transposase-like protein